MEFSMRKAIQLLLLLNITSVSTPNELLVMMWKTEKKRSEILLFIIICFNQVKCVKREKKNMRKIGKIDEKLSTRLKMPKFILYETGPVWWMNHLHCISIFMLPIPTFEKPKTMWKWSLYFVDKENLLFGDVCSGLH